MRYMIFSLFAAIALLAGFITCSRDMSTGVDSNESLTPANQVPISGELFTLASIPLPKLESSVQVDQIRGSLVWYNPYGQYLKRYIWPNRSFPSSVAQTQQILSVQFSPDSAAGAPQRTWAGVMQHIETPDTLFTNGKHLDILLHCNPYSEGVLHIDIGRISEDIIFNGKLDTEDKNGNGRLDDGEDVGLDGMANDDPRALAAGGDFWDLNDNGVKDEGEPFSNDDASYNPLKPGKNGIDYSHINGTEKNRNISASGIIPDSEDLNGNGVLDAYNDYFTFALHLSHSHEDYAAYVIYESIDKNTGDDYGWRLYRIPLADMTAVGSPSWQNVETVRLWLDGFEEEAYMAIASIEITGDESLESPLD